MKGLYWIPILTLLLGCYHDLWEHGALQSGKNRFNSAKLTYPPHSISDGIELELTRIGSEIYGYINVHAFELPPHMDCKSSTTLIISTHQKERIFEIPRLEGGQRARLTDDCLEYLLQILELKGSVTLKAGHYHETLDSTRFSKHYDRLTRVPIPIYPRGFVSFEL